MVKEMFNVHLDKYQDKSQITIFKIDSRTIDFKGIVECFACPLFVRNDKFGNT